MYVFDSYLLILYKSIVSPSIHENLHALSKTAQVINLVHYRQGIMTNCG